MLEFFNNVIQSINRFVWGPVILFFLLGVGIYLTIRTGFLPFLKIKSIWKLTFGSLFCKNKDNSGKGISPFQAMSTALAGTMGVGNIAGTATAITIGGPGAIFWMWISALVGMTTKYSEIVLAVKFRSTDKNGQYCGGPMYYMEKGLKMPWLGVVFSVLCALASFGIGNMTQVNTIACAMKSTFSVPPIATGITIAVLTGFIIIGGVKRIAKVTESLIPLMSIIYIVFAMIILFSNLSATANAFKLIISYGLNLNSAAGGITGYMISKAVKTGIARGVFTNEAGLGSAPIAHGASRTEEPVKQGAWGIFEVFLDTIVVCTITGLVILASGVWETSAADGVNLTSQAFANTFGEMGNQFITISVIVYALATLIGWSYYGEQCLYYIFRSFKAVKIYRVLFLIFIVLGAVLELRFVWSVSDTLNGMMAIPNLFAVIILSPVVISCTKKYFKNDIK